MSRFAIRVEREPLSGRGGGEGGKDQIRIMWRGITIRAGVCSTARLHNPLVNKRACTSVRPRARSFIRSLAPKECERVSPVDGAIARRASNANMNTAIITFQDHGVALSSALRFVTATATAAANGAHANAYTYISASSFALGNAVYSA